MLFEGNTNEGEEDIFLVKFGQPTATGTISGKVTKSDGKTAISGELVEALQSWVVERSATTDTSGNYSITVATGTCDVRASATGYQTQTKTRYTVSAGATTRDNSSAKFRDGLVISVVKKKASFDYLDSWYVRKSVLHGTQTGSVCSMLHHVLGRSSRSISDSVGDILVDTQVNKKKITG